MRHLRYQQSGLLRVDGRWKPLPHIRKCSFRLLGITPPNHLFHFIVHGSCLHRLVSLPKLVTVPGCDSTQDNNQRPSDQIAVLLPEMLELIKLLLFFEI